MEGSGTAVLRLEVAFVVLAALFAGLVGLPPRAAADTVVCGDITGATVWIASGNPFYATCPVNVPQGASLTVEAGVTVLFSAGAGLTVDGSLVVMGSRADPVVLDSNASSPAPGDWFGLSLGSSSYSQIIGLVVRHAETGLTASGGSPTGGSVIVRDSEFANNRDAGIVASGSTGLQGGNYLQHVSVHDNGAGIIANSSLFILDSAIQANGGNGIAAGVGPLYLSNSTVEGNGEAGISLWAITQVDPYRVSLVTCNRIAANGYGVRIEAFDPIGASANVATVHRNNFVNNSVQAEDASASSWDDGAAGNFWNTYTGTDGDGDGFGDVPFGIDADSQDRFPLMAPVAGCPGGGTADRPPVPAVVQDAQLTGAQLRDVTLTWDVSRDDGAGENDVTEYLLYTSPTFDGAGTGYTLLATLPPGTTMYTDAGAGIRDPANHFYRLLVRDATGQTAASPDQFAKYTRFLAAGAHLLTIPVQMSDEGIDTVLRGVDYRLARTYVNPAGQGKNWLMRAKDKPWGDLTTVDEGRALWLLVNRDSDLVVAGRVRATVTITLAVGWNFVGYPSFLDRTVGDAFVGVRYQSVEGFDPGSPPFYLRRLDASDLLRSGDGLWVHVSEPFDWSLEN